MYPCLQNRQAKGGSWRRSWLESIKLRIVPGETAFFLFLEEYRGKQRSPLCRRRKSVMTFALGLVILASPRRQPGRSWLFLQNNVRNSVCLQGFCSRQKGRIHFLVGQEEVEVWLCPCSRLTVCCIKWQIFRLHLVPHKLMYLNTWPPVGDAPQGGNETFRMWSHEGQSKSLCVGFKSLAFSASCWNGSDSAMSAACWFISPP